MDIKLINKFLASKPLIKNEILLKNNTISLNTRLSVALSEREELVKELKTKEEDILKISEELKKMLLEIQILMLSKNIKNNPIDINNEESTESYNNAQDNT